MKVSIYIDNFNQSSILLQPWHHIYEVAIRMVQEGISVTIFTGNKKKYDQVVNLNGLKIIRMYDFRLSNILLNKKSIIKVLSNDDADVLLWCATPLSFLYLTRFKTLGKPIALSLDKDILPPFEIFKRITLREFLYPHHHILWYQILMSLFPRFILKILANSSIIGKIIVPSQYIRKRLLNIGVKNHKIAVIPSTIDKNEFIISFEKSNLYLANHALQKDDFIITYMGSPCTLRGPDTVIQSIPIILKKHKNVKLLILSRRKSLLMEEEYLKNLIKKLNIESNVEIISGILNRQDLIHYIQISKVIVLPFKLLESEFPVSTLEVMSMGKVVISSNIGTLTEIIKKERGILVRPNNPKCLAKAIMFLIKNPESINKLGRNAKNYVNDLHDWNDITQLTINTLKEVMN